MEKGTKIKVIIFCVIVFIVLKIWWNCDDYTPMQYEYRAPQYTEEDAARDLEKINERFDDEAYLDKFYFKDFCR